jgi:hypothetical protein
MILFLQADGGKPLYCRYISGNWGARDGIPEVPDESLNGNPDIVVFAFDGFAIVVDERTGQRKASFLDRVNGSEIKFDIETKDIILTSENDYKKTVQNDESSTIVGDRSATVGGDETTQVVGDEDKTVGGTWKITVTGDVEIKSAGKLLLEGTPEVKIGQGATDNLALKTQLMAAFNNHTHGVTGVTVGTGAATCAPPLPQLTPAAFTTKTKAE